MENHFTRHILSVSICQLLNWFYPDLPFKISSWVSERQNIQNHFLRQLHQMILNFYRTASHIKTAWHFENIQNIVTVRDYKITSSKFSFGAIQNITVLFTISLKGFIHKGRTDQAIGATNPSLRFFNFFIRFP